MYCRAPGGNMRSNEPFRTIGTLRLHVMEGARAL